MVRPTHVVVDLSALKHNIAAMRAGCGKNVKYMAVIKANAYGHGIIEIAKAVVKDGVDYIGVAIPEEGVNLRKANINLPILTLSGILPESVKLAIQYDLSITVYSVELLKAAQEAAAALNKNARIHVKIDTGMNRVGIKSLDELRGFLRAAKTCSNIEIEGMYTHFAVSEIPDKSFTILQNERFLEAVKVAGEEGFSPMLHVSNSGGILDFPAFGYDMVRGGIAMYGYAPGQGCGKGISLEPVLTFKTAITHIKEIQPGETISYGRRYTAESVVRIATLPVGYGDGYSRCMSGKAQVLIRGKRAKVLGTICMDQCMVDVTHIPEAEIGDEVILIGRSGQAYISADELAEWANTISYEVLLDISARVPRVYTGQEG